MLKVARFLNIHMLRDSPSFSLSTSGFRNFTIFLGSWLFFLRTCSVLGGSVLWWIYVASRHLHHFHVLCLFSLPSLLPRSCRGTVGTDWEAKEGQTALEDLEEVSPQHNQPALHCNTNYLLASSITKSAASLGLMALWLAAVHRCQMANLSFCDHLQSRK